MADWEVLQDGVTYAIHLIRRQVHRKRLTQPEKKHNITDYPAIVVACGYERSHEVFWAQCASPINYIYSDRIKERLEALGTIGDKRVQCKNTIGACAEPHAADKVLKHFPGCQMNELQFSEAYRPRTAQRKRYCQNCKDTFPEVL